MMKLGIMGDVLLACQPEAKQSLPGDVAARWFETACSVRFIRASANFVFRVETPQASYALRFAHESERAAEYIRAELDFVTWLADRGLRVAKPIRSFGGEYLESVDTCCGVVHAVMFEAMPGRAVDEIEDLSPEQLRRWGRSLGELHRAAEDYPSPAGRPPWQDHLGVVAAWLPQGETPAWRELERVQEALAQLPTDAASFGLIHYDFELDNIIWQDDQPGLIDFDDCAWYWYVADLAFALRDLFDNRGENVDLGNEVFRGFLSGYREARDIGEVELDLIPLFLRMHNLTVAAKLYRTLSEGPREVEPPWMEGLRQKLRRALGRYQEAVAASDAAQT